MKENFDDVMLNNGLSDRFMNKTRGRKRRKCRGKCFIVYRKNGKTVDGDDRLSLVINIPGDIGYKIIKLIGDCVCIDFNDDGDIFAWSAPSRKIVANKNNGVTSSYSIYVSMMIDQYFALMGEFKPNERRPLKVELHHDCDVPYVVFRVSSER